MSHAYRLAPAGQIAPVNYMAIIFAGVWGFLLWNEVPDLYSVIGFCNILALNHFLLTLSQWTT
jgi:drug/metabolite transporter (DMT)-like permease